MVIKHTTRVLVVKLKILTIIILGNSHRLLLHLVNICQLVEWNIIHHFFIWHLWQKIINCIVWILFKKKMILLYYFVIIVDPRMNLKFSHLSNYYADIHVFCMVTLVYYTALMNFMHAIIVYYIYFNLPSIELVQVCWIVIASYHFLSSFVLFFISLCFYFSSFFFFLNCFGTPNK